MSDISSALISWIKIQGCLDEYITSFRDFESVEDFILIFEKLFNTKIDGNDNIQNVRQIIDHVSELIPPQVRNSGKIPEINIINLADCDFIELENATLLFLYAKYADKDHKEEFDKIFEQLNEYEKEEIKKYLIESSLSSSDVNILVAKARTYAKIYDDLLKNTKLIEEARSECDDEGENSLKTKHENKIIKLLEEQKSNIEKIEKENAKLKEEKREREERNKELEKECKTNTKKLIEEEKAKEKEIQEKIDSLDKKLSEITELRKQIEILENEEREVKIELKSKRSEKEEVGERIKEKKEKLEKLEKLKEEIENSNKDKKEDAEKRLEDAKQSIAKANQDMKDMKESPEINNAVEKLIKLRQDRDKKKSELNKILEEMKEIKRKLEE